MSWLRPSRTIVDLRGRTWEIYVTRTRIGAWKSASPDVPDHVAPDPRDGVFWLLLVPLLMALELIVGLLRLIALVPLSLASVATRRSLRVEAIVEDPTRQTYAWTVERLLLAGVLDEICAGLERGSIVQPADARFLGETE